MESTHLTNNTRYLEVCAATRKGSRADNQDRLRAGDGLPCPETTEKGKWMQQYPAGKKQYFAVADGIGGVSGGDIAAQAAICGLKCFLEEKGVEEGIRACGAAADQAVRCKFADAVEKGGTTLTLLELDGESYSLFNLGDSPAFLLRNGELYELSRRQNYETYMRERGLRPQKEHTGKLMAYAGMELDGQEPDAGKRAFVRKGKALPGDTFLLCSDGVTAAFSFEELERRLNRGDNARQLAADAAKGKQSDNCTAVMVTVGGKN